jgi:hypothetical protein
MSQLEARSASKGARAIPLLALRAPIHAPYNLFAIRALLIGLSPAPASTVGFLPAF